MLIENIIGLKEINAHQKTISWHLTNECKHGIRRLRFGDIIADLIYESNNVHIETSGDFKLIINKKTYDIDSKTQDISVSPKP